MGARIMGLRLRGRRRENSEKVDLSNGLLDSILHGMECTSYVY